MEQRIQSKRLADANSVVYLRGLVTDFKIEEMYINLYTDAKFMEIQRESKRMMYCNDSSMREISEGYFEHLIVDRVYVWSEFDKKEKPISKYRTYCVLFFRENKSVECECKLFECSGILCRHCIKVLDCNKFLICLMMVVFEPISNLASDNDETMMMVIEGLKELEMKVKKKTTPTLPISSVGETGFKSTPASVNNTRRALTFETPSSVGKSGVEGVVVQSTDEVQQLRHQDIVVGLIKDPRSKRGAGTIRCTRFMTTFEEVRRQKELSKKKYEEKKAREERSKQKAIDKQKSDECVSNLTDLVCIQVSEETVVNESYLRRGEMHLASLQQPVADD
uniref:SWIM-type domain-containing protein n=1 Tax=Chenopodium quinoa TaxID=63459 RepID=A0A803MZF2_CHEQI